MNLQTAARSARIARRPQERSDDDPQRRTLALVRKATARLEDRILRSGTKASKWQQHRDSLALLAAFSPTAMKEYRQADEAYSAAEDELRRLHEVRVKLDHLHDQLGGESAMSMLAASQLWKNLKPYLQEAQR